MDLKVSNNIPHKGLYEATAYVQNHTLINRGITTLGGSTIPQCIMSNNKYESQERAIMGGIYFVASYLTPILLLPLYNKHFLKNKGIIKSLDSAGKNIIQVSKKFLTPDANLKQGLKLTSQRFKDPKVKDSFDEIYNRYNNPEKLKKDLLSVHEKVLMTDFITTAAMWSLIPWVATESTEKRTKRKDFSGGFNLKKDNKNHESKLSKILWNIAFSVVPGILFSKAVTKALSQGVVQINRETPILKQISQNFLNKIAKNPTNFDYTSGTNMSKTIYAAIWVLSSFPAKLISSRDTNERRDRCLRDIGLFTMFFGGDFLINNILGRLSDKFLKTEIMPQKCKYSGFWSNFKHSIRNFKNLDNLGLPPKILKKTKTIGAGIYWTSLLLNTALIGFALPNILNKILRYNIKNQTNNIKDSISYVVTESYNTAVESSDDFVDQIDNMAKRFFKDNNDNISKLKNIPFKIAKNIF